MLALSEYAAALSHSGQDLEAEHLARKVFHLRHKIFGPSHPDTIVALERYSSVLDRLGYQSDVQLLGNVLELVRQDPALERSDTLAALSSVPQMHEAHRLTLRSVRTPGRLGPF